MPSLKARFDRAGFSSCWAGVISARRKTGGPPPRWGSCRRPAVHTIRWGGSRRIPQSVFAHCLMRIIGCGKEKSSLRAMPFSHRQVLGGPTLAVMFKSWRRRFVLVQSAREAPLLVLPSSPHGRRAGSGLAGPDDPVGHHGPRKLDRPMRRCFSSRRRVQRASGLCVS